MSHSDDMIIARLTLWLLTAMILAAVPVAVWQGIDRFQHGNYVEAGIALLGVICSILGVRHLGARFRTLLRELRREETVAQGQSMAPLARPQVEYDQQMRALLTLVAAKTGLPLLNLR